MAEKSNPYKQYKGSMSYRKFKTSLVCVITGVIMYAFIEILYNALGYFLDVDLLNMMAMYLNIPMLIFVGIFVTLAIVQFKKFKTKVDDGTIKEESMYSNVINRMYGSILGNPMFMPGSSDALLNPVEKKIKGIVQMYPRITLDEIASKAGVPSKDIEDLLLKLLSSGIIKGHVDPGTSEFISGMIDTSRVRPIDDAVFDCPHCGAVMKSAPVRGTSVRCTSCGNLIVVK